MNILYTCDNNYVWLMGISMLSLFENNKSMDTIKVYLLGENITDESKDNIDKIAKKYDRDCVIIDIPELVIPDSLCSQRWPKSAFTRLYAAKLLPNNVDKVLYLDCDTIIKGEITSLWDIDMGECAIYGVRDCIGLKYLKNIGLSSKSVYINAGVLLMNLERISKIDVNELINSFLKKYSRTIHYADQDVLNGMFEGKLGILPAEYNVMTLEYIYNFDEIILLRHPVNYYGRKEIEYAVQIPKIVHFTTCMLNIRPWFDGSTHPQTKDFLFYKSLSPWNNRLLEPCPNKQNAKSKILLVLNKLPPNIRIKLLGYIHAEIHPIAISFGAKGKLILYGRSG